jgi:uncharacterized membrane protein YfcA
MSTLLLAPLCGLSVGLVLGLTGGGGAILAVPQLVYVLGFPVKQGVALSLATVAGSALFGAVAQSKGGLVSWSRGIVIGIGGIIGVPGGKAIGEQLSDRTTMLIFASLMTYIGGKMILSRRGPRAPQWLQCPPPRRDEVMSIGCILRLITIGVATGVLSGLCGVGGGFLIVPALIAVAQLEVPQAIATSLVAVSSISLTGIVSHRATLATIAPGIPLFFLIGSLIGMLAGVRLKRKIPARVLQIMFGCLVLSVAAVVVVRSW